MSGEALTRGAIWLALLAAVAATAGARLAARRGSEGWFPTGRALWSVGVSAYLVHVVAAFHFFYDWSHTRALDETARQTAEVIGWQWGGGLYANYAFTGLWVGDVGWQWLAPSLYQRRPRLVAVGWEATFFFMAFQATVVFETGAIRWCGVAGALLLAWLWLGRSGRG